MNEPQAKPKSNFIVWLLIGLGGGVFVLVFCGGGLAAVAIPALLGYMQESKTAEAETQLNALYSAAALHYEQENFSTRAVDQMDGGGAVTGCAVDSASTANAPGPSKTMLGIGDLPESFVTLGWMPSDPVYYQYEIVSVGGCGHPVGTEVYHFIAHGDLDGDAVESRFELIARATADGTLERDPSITRTDALE